ncbi:hypothetical protein D0T84_00185 [Dysgonomonas sp. 521]|uniref:winged helix-turn-helix domain-containing protein n=1 Tax=Dysgonomonas sp. 521 TaxID=2302932 RepID=UPI0013D50490|nr:winged helix-turn-helix domain-containing protein [Dysgonomonas sp. 521]NDV93337.1 hypothetical protein [Dysgonomonas sp. 521]
MLKKDIGINAGAIWRYLSEKGRLSIKEIEELTNYKDSFILLALGWLSRENKIKFSNDNDNLYVELISDPSEIYY